MYNDLVSKMVRENAETEKVLRSALLGLIREMCEDTERLTLRVEDLEEEIKKLKARLEN